jgi:hypothetical protein
MLYGNVRVHVLLGCPAAPIDTVVRNQPFAGARPRFTSRVD